MKPMGILGGLLLTGLLLPGCRNLSNPQVDAPEKPIAVANPMASSVTAATTDRSDEVGSPTREARFEGKVQSINRDRRQVTFRLDDGKAVRLKVGAQAGDFNRLEVGDRAEFRLRETVEILQDTYFHPETGHLVNRAPPGGMAEREQYNTYYQRPPTGHHEVNWSEVIEIPARVFSVDPASRLLKLLTYDGRLLEVKTSVTGNAGKEMEPFGIGKPVVARFRELDSIKVIDSP